MPLNTSAVISAKVLRLNIFLNICGIILFSFEYTQITVYYSLGLGGSPSPNKYPYVAINSGKDMTNLRGIPGPCCTR
jgi:hypothetical protein